MEQNGISSRPRAKLRRRKRHTFHLMFATRRRQPADQWRPACLPSASGQRGGLCLSGRLVATSNEQ